MELHFILTKLTSNEQTYELKDPIHGYFIIDSIDNNVFTGRMKLNIFVDIFQVTLKGNLHNLNSLNDMLSKAVYNYVYDNKNSRMHNIFLLNYLNYSDYLNFIK